MNLPTREEAKNVVSWFEMITHLCRKTDNYLFAKEYKNAYKLLQAYSSGSLIEARTEGEIGE